ncbi:hypothetical protein K474DRAFT_1030151 [Panus rudis PR-1116 ss-1]|nr:hypothetical protein K474DRAFT_1030151 [Panus rudis PR-1116 ss-1]
MNFQWGSAIPPPGEALFSVSLGLVPECILTQLGVLILLRCMYAQRHLLGRYSQLSYLGPRPARCIKLSLTTSLGLAHASERPSSIGLGVMLLTVTAFFHMYVHMVVRYTRASLPSLQPSDLLALRECNPRRILPEADVCSSTLLPAEHIVWRTPEAALKAWRLPLYKAKSSGTTSPKLLIAEAAYRGYLPHASFRSERACKSPSSNQVIGLPEVSDERMLGRFYDTRLSHGLSFPISGMILTL